MKKTITTISVDLDALNAAKTKIPNISSYLNDCLHAINGKSDEDRTKEQLEIELKDLQAQNADITVKMAICKESLKSLEESKKLRQIEALEAEKFKRWNCGACHHLNFMESIKCDGCRLPTREDSKTTIVYIKGDLNAN